LLQAIRVRLEVKRHGPQPLQFSRYSGVGTISVLNSTSVADRPEMGDIVRLGSTCVNASVTCL
jgi:hypothetical protein